MVVDYSRQLDSFPLPRINELVNGIAQYRVLSIIDLRSTYHQVPLRQEEKPYTAFEAGGGCRGSGNCLDSDMVGCCHQS